MLTKETIKEFMDATARTEWNLSYGLFLRRLGRDKPNAWTNDLWLAFKGLALNLRCFDPDTLLQVLTEPGAEVHSVMHSAELSDRSGRTGLHPACGVEGHTTTSPGQVTCPECRALAGTELGENGGG